MFLTFFQNSGSQLCLRLSLTFFYNIGTVLEGHTRETSERLDGAHMDLPERVDAISNWSELKKGLRGGGGEAR